MSCSRRMIKQRCKEWHYQKNAKKDDWGVLAILDDKRKKAGKPLTVFEIHGQRRTTKDLHRFIRNQQTTPEDFLAAYLNSGHKVPPYIRALTPEAGSTKVAPPSANDPYPDLGSPSSDSTSTAHHILSESPQLTHQSSTNPSSPHRPGIGRRRLLSSKGDVIKHESSPQIARTNVGPSKEIGLSSSSTPTVCQYPQTQLLQMSGQILQPSSQASHLTEQSEEYWAMITPRACRSDSNFDIAFTCSKCHQPSSLHFPSIDNFEPRKQYLGSWLEDSRDEHFHLPVSTPGEGAWIWMSRCFLACIFFSRGQTQLGQTSLNDAAQNFKVGLDKKDPLLLTAAHMIIIILHTHDQDEIAFRILKAAQDVVDEHLEVDDPIRTTITYFTYSANETLKENGFTSTALGSVYQNLNRQYGTKHPYTITALHNYGWMLRYENQLEEAEFYLRQAYEASLSYFSKLHMQTVASLVVLTGVLRPQEARRSECISHYRTAVSDATEILHETHPYVLRLRWELAGQLKLTGRKSHQDEVVELYKEVFEGRALMLGRRHGFTTEARVMYEDTLKEFNLWMDGDQPSKRQIEIEQLYKSTPADGWREIDDDGDDDDDVNLMNERNGYEVEYKEQGSANMIRVRSRSQPRTPSPTFSNDYRAY